MDNKLGDLFVRALRDIRYTIPSATDGERFRWPSHQLWTAAERSVTADLAELMTGVEPGVVKSIRREQLARSTEAQVKGLMATYALAKQLPIEGDAIAAELERMAKEHVK